MCVIRLSFIIDTKESITSHLWFLASSTISRYYHLKISLIIQRDYLRDVFIAININCCCWRATFNKPRDKLS